MSEDFDDFDFADFQAPKATSVLSQFFASPPSQPFASILIAFLCYPIIGIIFFFVFKESCSNPGLY